MKILMTHRYFWPDTAPYAVMLRSIAHSLAGQPGNDVRVFASVPSYRNMPQGYCFKDPEHFKVTRVRVFCERGGGQARRVANVMIYCVALFVQILRQRPDVVTAATFPPVVAAVTAAFAARIVGAKFVYHMQDVHPDVSVHAGGRMGRAPIVGVMRWLDGYARRRATLVIVLSEDMRQTVISGTKGALPEILVLNNIALDGFAAGTPHAARQLPAGLHKADGMYRIIFAGNLGRFQNLELLVQGVLQGIEGRAKTELFFLGDGDALEGLKARWGRHPQVRFGPFLPFDQARGLIAEADLGLVSLSPGIYRVSYPSKVLTYVALGLPMLALVEPQSQLARTIRAEGLGAVPVAATPLAIADALRSLIDGPDLRPRVRGYHGRVAAQEMILKRWQAVMAGLDDV